MIADFSPVERSDPAHTERGGMSMKGPDSSCAPLCRFHHNQFDGKVKLANGEVGRRAFEDFYHIDMQAIAKAWWEAYLKKSPPKLSLPV